MASERLYKLAEAFKNLTYSEMKELAEVMSTTIDSVNGMKVKPEVFAEVLDAFGEYIVIAHGDEDD